VFGLILTLAYVVLLGYTVWRASSIPFLTRHLPKRHFWTIGSVLLSLFLVGRFLGHGSSWALASALDVLGLVLLAKAFLVASLLLVVDVVTLCGFFFRKWVPAMRGAALALGLTLSGIALVQGLRPPEVTSYEVTLPHLPKALDGTVVVALSDMHLGPERDEEWFGERMDQVKELNPDLLVFLGDSFEGHERETLDLSVLRSLSVPMGVWFVDGNHESHGNHLRESNPLLQAGATRLADQCAEIAPGLTLAGVSDLTAQRRSNVRNDAMGDTLACVPKGASILLSHTPWEAGRAADAGVGLMLSGHTHGGQIWPFNYLVQQTYPLLAGSYDLGSMTAIVSRGAGLWGPPMRLWLPSEIVKVTLRAP